MGGVAGGMAHLYNDPTLTFNDIKKILSAASKGEIQGTEKTDGYNIYLGYVNGKARAARNKGDMAKGGMDFALLAAREFKGGPEVRKVYLDAFRAYQKALASLSEKELAAIFGENGEIFYNTEIQGPSASNVVNYDANVLSIHPFLTAFLSSSVDISSSDINFSRRFSSYVAVSSIRCFLHFSATSTISPGISAVSNLEPSVDSL